MEPPVIPSRLPLPSWGMNLAGFGLLIVLVLAVFFWQMTTIDHDLQRSTFDRSRMIAAVIEENLLNAALARTTIDSVVTSLLRDKARFVDYLNAIDPLQPEELEALARETGLLGIGLVRTDGEVVAGPSSWQPKDTTCALPPGIVHYDPEQQTGLLTALATSEYPLHPDRPQCRRHRPPAKKDLAPGLAHHAFQPARHPLRPP